MKDLYLLKSDSDVTNACKIVDFVKEYEKEHGLSEEEIMVKYTQAYCSTLADSIRMVFGFCLDKVIDTRTFFLKEDYEGRTVSHTYAQVGEDVFVDIFGAHTQKQVEEFALSGFLSDPEAVEDFEINRDRYASTGNIMYECLGHIHAKEDATPEKNPNSSVGTFRNL